LYDGAIVLLYACKEPSAYLFYRRKNKIYCWMRGHKRGEEATTLLFRRSDVLVLYDPPESIDGGAFFGGGARKLVVAMSANEKHRISMFEKNQLQRVYLGPLSDNELQIMIPQMMNDYNASILKWKEIVGNLPRYIINDDKFEARKERIETALRLNANDLWEYLKSTKDRGSNTLPGTLYTIDGTHRSLFANKSEDTRLLMKIDYEGNHINFNVRLLRLISPFVRDEIYFVNRELIFLFRELFPEDHVTFGRLFESLVLSDLGSVNHVRLNYTDLRSLERVYWIFMGNVSKRI
jgi:hypothetical protein